MGKPVFCMLYKRKYEERLAHNHFYIDILLGGVMGNDITGNFHAIYKEFGNTLLHIVRVFNLNVVVGAAVGS